MNWDKIQIRLTLIVLAIIVVLGFSITHKQILKDLKSCDWCYEKMFEEGTQIQQFWYHDLCFSNLDMLYIVLKIEQNEADWIVETTKRRNEYRERVKGLVYPE